MGRSLDGLIHHLLDQIALCGEYGASPLDFTTHVSSYYRSPKEAVIVAENEPGPSTTSSAPNVDRLFLEQVWRWVTARPEIRLGNHPSHRRLTLSEVEARNATIGGSKSFQAVSQSLQDNSAVTTSHGPDFLGSIQDELDVQHVKQAISADTTTPNAISKETAEHHVTDRTNVQHVQPNRVSGGRGASKKPAQATKGLTQKSQIRLYASENRVWHALTGHGPDTQKVKPLELACLSGIAASGFEGIYQHDLVKQIGQDKRSVPLRTERLFENGYIQKERVTIQLFDPKRLLHTSRLLHKRFAKDTLDQTKRIIQSPTASGPVDDDTSGTVDSHEPRDSEHLEPVSQVREGARKFERPIPKWTPDRLLGNQIFDLVDRSGSKGMSVNDIRDNLLSEYVRRPTAEFVTRLCECWQMSQPLHLRHLSMIRDTVLKGRGSVYNYYTYRNFIKLVDKGTGFWEAVVNVPDDMTAGPNFAAALNAVPKLDEYGFSVIDTKLFCGSDNEATIEDCVSMLKSRTLFPLWKNKRKSARQIDDEQDTQLSPAKAASKKPKVLARKNASSKSNTPKLERPGQLGVRVTSGGVRPVGRPRKQYPADPLKLQRSLKYAEQYVRNKIEKEMAERIYNGEDATSVAPRVLEEFENFRKETGQDPLSAYTKGMILQTFAGGPEPQPLQIQESPQKRPEVATIWPSMAAHTILVPKPPGKSLIGSRKHSKPERKVDNPLKRAPQSHIHLSESSIEADTQRAKKKPRRTVDAIHTTVEPYWPSVAAHSWPSSSTPSLSRSTAPEKAKRKRGRPRKQVYPQTVRKDPSDPQFRYLPSIFAHSGSFLPSISLPITHSQRRKEARKLPTERDSALLSPTNPKNVQHVLYSPTTAAHTPSFLPVNVSPPAQATRARINQMKSLQSEVVHSSPFLTSPTPEVSRASRSLHAGPYPEGFYPGWVKYMSKYYDEALSSVSREGDGVYLSKTKHRRKRYTEPQGFRPESYKVVVIKLKRLCELSWFSGTDKMLPPTTSALNTTPSFVNTPDPATCPPSAQEVDVPPAPQAYPPSSPQEARMGPDPSESPPASESYFRLEKAPQYTPRNTGTWSTAEGVVLKAQDKVDRFDKPNPPYTQSSLANSFQNQSRTIDASRYSAIHRTESRRDEKQIHHQQLPPNNLATGSHSARANPPQVMPSQTSRMSQEVQKASGPALEETEVAILPDALYYGSAQYLSPGVGKAASAVKEVLPGPRGENAIINDANSSAVGLPASASKSSDFSVVIGKVTPPEDRADIFPIVSKELVTSTQASKNDAISDAIGESNFARNAEPFEVPPPSISTSLAKTQSGNGGPTSASSGPKQIPGLSGLPHVNPPALSLPEMNDPQTPSQPESIIIKPKRVLGRKTVGNMSRQGGSVAMLRKKVVMEIVDQCGGVYPGHRELVKAFVIEWEKKGLEGGTPDERTMQSTVNALHNDGKIRQIYFFFKDRKGMKVKKDMLIYPSIDVMDPRVKDLQKRMIAYYPRSYWPNAVVPPGDYTFSTKRMMEGKDRVKDYKYEALKDQELAQIEQRTRDEMGKGSPTENTHIELEQLLMVPSVPKMTPSHATRRPGGSKRKRQTLASLKRPFARGRSLLAALLEPSPPPPGSQDLLWLPEKYAFSEFNYEEERPTVLEPTIRENDRRRHARYGSRIKDLRPHHSLSPLVPMQSRSPLSVSQSSNRRGKFPGSQARYSHYSPHDVGMDGGDSTTLVNSLELSESGPDLIWLAPEQIDDFQPESKQLVVNTMDAIHYFHQTSGTFSVGFSGIAPPRHVNRDLGTCSKPYSHGPRAIHPEFPTQRAPRHIMPKRSLEDQDTVFEKEVDDLMRQELELTGLEDANSGHSTFINHVFLHDHTTAQAAVADMNLLKGVIVPSDGGRIIHKKFENRRMIRPRISGGLRFSRKRNRSINPGAPDNFKRRRLNTLAEGTVQGRSSKTARLDPGGRSVNIRRVRGPRSTMSIDDERRLVTAVLIVRTLTGGLNKRVDWVLVNCIFGSSYEPDFPYKRWSYLRYKFKHVIPDMEANFQDRFAKAYEEGSVPAPDFENLQDYDWKWLFEWTLEHLGQSNQSQPDLPAERAEFDDLYALKDTSQININDYYEINTKDNNTVAKREDLLTNISYVYPIHNRVLRNESQSENPIAVAKTWIRANSIVPSDTYHPNDASLKLGTLPDQVLNDALSQLLSDRVLWQENKGRLIPGRNYYLNENCISRLVKNITSASFRQAVAFKHHLDEAFKDKGSIVNSYAADDGHMLAMVNLAAHKRISLVPVDVPLNEWGHVDSGYESRQMDLNRLNFQVDLQPLPSYVYGNPLEPLPAPPSRHLQDPMARIPLWYDIYGELMPGIWDLALAIVMAILAVRSGVDAGEIEKETKPALEAWEIELVLGWLVDAKAAVKSGCGYTLEEWWWMALPGDGEPEPLDLPTTNKGLMEVHGTSERPVLNTAKRLEVAIEEPTEVHDINDERTSNTETVSDRGPPVPSQPDSPTLNEDPMEVDDISDERTLNTGKEPKVVRGAPTEALEINEGRTLNTDKEPDAATGESTEAREISDVRTPNTSKEPVNEPPASAQLPDRLFTDFRARPTTPSDGDSPMDDE